MKALLSIDPGKGGAVALFVDSRPVWVEKWTDEFEMSDLILDAQNQYAELSAVIENVHSMPGQGVVSMFSFGENYGIWRGVLIALGIPHERITAKMATRIWCRNAQEAGKKTSIVQDCKRAFSATQTNAQNSRRAFNRRMGNKEITQNKQP